MKITPGPETSEGTPPPVIPEAQPPVAPEAPPLSEAPPALAPVDGVTAAPAPEAPPAVPPPAAPAAETPPFLPETPLTPVAPPLEATPPTVPPAPDAEAHIKSGDPVALEGSVGGTPPSEGERNVGQLADQDAAAESGPPPEVPPPTAAPEIWAETDPDQPLVAPEQPAALETAESLADQNRRLAALFRAQADDAEKQAQRLRALADDLEAKSGLSESDREAA